MNLNWRERLLTSLNRRKILRLSEYTTHLAVTQGILDAAQTFLRPQVTALDAEKACKLLLDAQDALVNASELVNADMDKLCGHKIEVTR